MNINYISLAEINRKRLQGQIPSIIVYDNKFTGKDTLIQDLYNQFYDIPSYTIKHPLLQTSSISNHKYAFHFDVMLNKFKLVCIRSNV